MNTKINFSVKPATMRYSCHKSSAPEPTEVLLLRRISREKRKRRREGWRRRRELREREDVLHVTWRYYILVYHIHIYFMYLSNLSVYPRLILKILSRFQNYSSIKSVSSVLNVEDLQMRILPWWWDRRIWIMYSDKRIYNLTVNSALQRSLKFQRSTLRRLLQYLLKPQLYLSSYNISLVTMSPKTSAISLQLQSILKLIQPFFFT